MSRVLLAVLALLAGCAAPVRAEAGMLDAVFDGAPVPEPRAVVRVAVVGIAAGEGTDERRSAAERHNAAAAAFERWSGGRVTVRVTRIDDREGEGGARARSAPLRPHHGRGARV